MHSNLVSRSLHLILPFTLLLIGCRSASQIMAKSEVDIIESRLPALELAVDPGPLMATEGAYPDDPEKLFNTEMKRNVLEPADSTVFGYAKLQVTKADVTRKGKGFQAIQMLTLLTPSLLGLPLESYCTDIQAEVQIMDAQGHVLGTYTGSGKSNVRVAMYHGYSQSKAPRLADVEALRQALSQIRPQLANDADTLRQQLLHTGPVETIIGAAY